MCSCIFSLWENGIPHNKLFKLRGRVFNPSKNHVQKRAENNRCKVNTLGTLASNFSMFLRFLKGIHFRNSLTESELGDRFQKGKFLKTIEHVSYSIRYCKISLLTYLGSNSLSNAGRLIFYSPGRAHLG